MSTDQLRQDLKLAPNSLAAVADPAVKNALGEIFALFEGVADAIDEVSDELDEVSIGIEPERAAIVLTALQKTELVVAALRAIATGPLAAHFSDTDKQQIEALCVETVTSVQAAVAAVAEVTLEDVVDEEH